MANASMTHVKCATGPGHQRKRSPFNKWGFRLRASAIGEGIGQNADMNLDDVPQPESPATLAALEVATAYCSPDLVNHCPSSPAGSTHCGSRHLELEVMQRPCRETTQEAIPSLRASQYVLFRALCCGASGSRCWGAPHPLGVPSRVGAVEPADKWSCRSGTSRCEG